MRTAAVVAVVLLMVPLPASGHPNTNSILGGPLTSRPVQEWDLAVRLEGALTPTLVNWYNNVVREKPKPPVAPRVFRGMGTNVEQWRLLVQTYFAPDDVDMALRIMACESGGNPKAKNPHSTASGLYQHLRGWWSGAWGLSPFDPFDPEQSVQAAAALRYTHGGWGDWNASKHCWG